MKISIITLFPGMFEQPLGTSMLKKAQDKGLVEFDVIDLRQFGIGPRQQVDDRPYGGGDGMVLRPEPVVAAIETVQAQSQESVHVVLLTPQGKRLKQATVQGLSQCSHLLLVCGHYEGFDERIRSYVDEQLSIGDYVLTGGELPALVVADAVTRLIPGVLGGETSAQDESFSDGESLEYPHYTRPEDFRGQQVPEVLRSGDHQRIQAWRRQQRRQQD